MQFNPFHSTRLQVGTTVKSPDESVVVVDGDGVGLESATSQRQPSPAREPHMSWRDVNAIKFNSLNPFSCGHPGVGRQQSVAFSG